jgi:hypothetical protein
MVSIPHGMKDALKIRRIIIEIMQAPDRLRRAQKLVQFHRQFIHARLGDGNFLHLIIDRTYGLYGNNHNSLPPQAGDQMTNELELAHELTEILSDLIAIPSTYPPGDTKNICAYTSERYSRAGYQCEIHTRVAGIESVVARAGSGGRQLALNCHIDTVDVGERADWHTDPSKAKLQSGMIYGLGANNCKGSTALHIWLGEEIMRAGGPKQGEIVFTFTGDEERLGP